MKALLCLLTILTASLTAYAHPGIGIVQDSRGNVFFTDLKQVWKIAPDGKKSVAVPNVHTHELCLDNEDNLYGEHLWYEGEQTNKWGHRVWCLKRDGKLVDVIPAREGFLQNYSFVRDRAGNHYWAERGTQTLIKKRTATGQTSTHATGNFHDVRWMTAVADGTLYLIDQGDLRRITPAGQLSTLVHKVSERTLSPSGAATRHHHMGLWLDAAENIYVAVAGERLVMKVLPGGKATVAARSPWPWSPSGGLLDRDGKLWLLEYSLTNAVRARRIDRNGAEQIF